MILHRFVVMISYKQYLCYESTVFCPSDNIRGCTIWTARSYVAGTEHFVMEKAIPGCGIFTTGISRNWMRAGESVRGYWIRQLSYFSYHKIRQGTFELMTFIFSSKFSHIYIVGNSLCIQQATSTFSFFLPASFLLPLPSFLASVPFTFVLLMYWSYFHIRFPPFQNA